MYLVFYCKYLQETFGYEDMAEWIANVEGEGEKFAGELLSRWSEFAELAKKFRRDDAHMVCKNVTFGRIFMHSPMSNEQCYYLCNAAMFYCLWVWESEMVNPELNKLTYVKRLKNSLMRFELKECKDMVDTFVGIYIMRKKEFDYEAFRAWNKEHLDVNLDEENREQRCKLAYAMLLTERTFLGNSKLSLAEMLSGKEHMFGNLTVDELEYVDLFLKEHISQ
jgi:hypothetical protein